MSNRLTSDWMENSEQAFGAKGKHGDLGERLALELFDDLRIVHNHNPDDYHKQLAGKDIEIFQNGKWLGVDVKANIHSDRNQKVCIDWPKLSQSKATYWLHINTNDHLNDYIIYKVIDMLLYINRNQIPQVGSERLCWVKKVSARTL